MDNGFSDNGLCIFDEENLHGLFDCCMDAVRIRKFKDRTYLVLPLDEKTEIWKYSDFKSKGYYAPFFKPNKTLSVQLEDWDRSEAVAMPCFMHAELTGEELICLDIDVLNLFEHTELDYTKPVNISLFCHTVCADIYTDEGRFRADHPRLATESFIMDGSSEDDYDITAMVNGHISRIEKRHSDKLFLDYYCYEIDCLGYTFCCTTGNINTIKNAKAGDIVSAILEFHAKIE